MRALEYLLPPACASCGRLGAVLCTRCRHSFTPPSSAGDALLSPNPGAFVGEELALAITAFTYDGPLRKALARLKYAGARRVAGPLADAALASFARLVRISGSVPIAAVPAHPGRLSERGYNQAALLADALASRAGLTRVDPLVRLRSTERQHRLDRAARLRNLESAFAPAPSAQPPRTLIVVDDILTTAATLEACARVLRRHGTERVYGFALAREV